MSPVLQNVLQKIEGALRDAWAAEAWKLPSVEIGGQRKAARKVLIQSVSQRATSGSPEAAGILHVWVKSRELSSGPIELNYLPPNSWRLSNHNKGDVRAFAGSSLVLAAKEGESVEIPASKFRVRVFTQQFDFTAVEKRWGELQSIQISALVPDASSEASSCVQLTIDDCVCELVSPKGFWHEAEEVRDRFLIDAWQRFAKDFNPGIASPLTIRTEPSPPSPGPDRRGFTVTAKIDGKSHTFVFFAPGSLLGRFRQPREPEPQWQYLVSIGHQDISLRRLKALRRTDVVVLRDSRLLYETFTGRCWALDRKGPGAYMIGAEQNPVLQWEISMNETSNHTDAPPEALIDSISVRIQAVLTSEPVKFSELRRYLPGQTIPVNAGPGAKADIYINGRKVGHGLLVTIPADGSAERLGLRVLDWNG